MSDELNVLAGAYALDALDDDERTIFEDHLKSCSDCAEEVRGLQNAAAELTHTVSVAPPAALRGDVLGAIKQVRPLAPLTDNVIALHRSRASRSVWQFMAAACALIAIATSAWGYQQHRALNRSKTTASSAYSVLSERDATATSGAIGTSGNATLVYSKSTGHMVLVAHGIRAAAQGKTYQLWTISPSGTATSAGLFTPNGSGDVLVRASGDLANASKLGISVEPAGGSAQPTPGAIIVTMNL